MSGRRDSIDIYARKHNLSDEVISMLYADNIYAIANSALGYRGRDIEEKRAFFLDSIFDIFNDENTKIMIFPYHLTAIMNHFPDIRDNAPVGTVRDIMYACDEDVPVPDRSVFFNKKYYDRLMDMIIMSTTFQSTGLSTAASLSMLMEKSRNLSMRIL